MSDANVHPILSPHYAMDSDAPTYTPEGGLTKRELFAAMIAQGIAARGPVEGEADPSIDGRCAHAVKVADALIAALHAEVSRG